MIASIITMILVAVAMVLCIVYDPFLDVVQGGGQKHLVLWYTASKNRRDYIKLFTLPND